MGCLRLYYKVHGELKIGPWLNYRVRTKTETSAENMRIVFSLCLLSLLLQLSTSCNKIREIIQSVFPASGEEGGAPAWPTEPVVENNYEAKGQMIKLDDTMQAYQTGSGEKVIIWSTDTTGITDEKIDSKATKEWADFLAEEGGYTVLIPDWFRGNNQPEGGYGFGTDAQITWSKEVTNWTKIETDWKNVVLPYLETKLSAPLSIGLIGTCWGSYPVVFLSRFNNIKCGISMHPSHPGLIAQSGQDESEVLSQIVAPQLFMSEGISFLPTGLPPSLYAGGLADQILGDKITIEKFDDMMHGWTVGGDLSNPNVAKGVEKAKKLALEFFAKHL